MAIKKKMGEEKKPSKQPPRDMRAAAFLEHVNKKMKGHAQVKAASEYVLPFITKRMPTGLLSLDVELKGGVPCGGITQIVGPKNSCKTYLAWQIIRQQQFYKGEKLKVLLAMTEMRADRTQARLAGVAISLGDEDIASLEQARMANNVEPYTSEQRSAWKKAAREQRAGNKDWDAMKPKEQNAILDSELDAMDAERMKFNIPPFTPEELKILKTEVGTIHEVHGDSAERLFDAILKAVHDSVYHIIVIDSFGSIMSEAEAESESLSEKTYGGAAKPITEFLRKLGSMLTMDDEYGGVRDVCIIGINQVRDAIGEPNKEYRSTGGRALEHAKFVDLFVRSGAQEGYEGDVFTSAGMKKRWVQTGKRVNWKIEKGKAGIHEGGTGEFIFDFRTGAGDFYSDTIAAGVNYGAIEKNGNYYSILNPNDPTKSLLTILGRENMVQELAKDAAKHAAEGSTELSLMNLVRAEVFKKQGIYINYDWD